MAEVSTSYEDGGDASMPLSGSEQGGSFPDLCSCGYGRRATNASGCRYAWHCDPSVTEEKRQALRRSASGEDAVAR